MCNTRKLIFFFFILTIFELTEIITCHGNHFLNNDYNFQKRFDNQNYKIDEYNHVNEISNQNKFKTPFYTHGDFAALSAMNFEQNMQNQRTIGNKTLYPALMSFLVTSNYTHICATEDFSLAVTNNREVVFFGMFGVNFGEISFNSGPRIIWRTNNNEYVEQLECGSEHAFIRTNLNKVYGFGSSHFGQLGYENFVQLPTFFPHTSLENIVHISLNLYLSLFIDTNNYLWVSGISNVIKSSYHIAKRINYQGEYMKALDCSSNFNVIVMIGKDNCLYYIGTFFDKQSIDIQKYSEIECDKVQVFINKIGNRIVTKNINNKVEQFTFINDIISRKVLYENLEHKIIKFTTIETFMALHLSNGKVLGSTIEPHSFYYNLNVTTDFNILKFPESVGEVGDIRQIQCTYFHCLALGQFEGFFTAGEITYKTCNLKNENFIKCSNINQIYEETKVLTVIPFFTDRCKIAVMEETRIIILNCINSNTTEGEMESSNYYPPKEYFSRGPIFSAKNDSIFGILSKQLLISIDLSSYKKNNNNFDNTDIYMKLSKFDDFIYASTIVTRSHLYYGIFHLAKGVNSKSLAIVSFDSSFHQKEIILIIEKVQDFWIASNYDRDESNIYGIKDNCTLFKYNLNQNIIDFYSPIDKCLNFIKIVANDDNYIFALDSEGIVYQLNTIINSQYEINNEIGTHLNRAFIHISMTADRHLYMISNTSELYYLNINDVSYIMKVNKENVTHLQPFTIQSATGMQIYENFTCNGYIADDIKVCNGHGRCMLNNRCICIENYFGIDCNYNYTCYNVNPLSNQVCSGHGKCKKQDTCNCDTNYKGDMCQCNGEFLFNKCINHKTILITMIACIVILFIIILPSPIFALGMCYYYKVKSDKHYFIEKKDMYERFINEKKDKNHLLGFFLIDEKDIKLGKVLGKGNEAVVYLAQYNRIQVAVKIYKSEFQPLISDENSYKREIELMSALRHPNVVGFHGSFLTNTDQNILKLGFVMEYVPKSVDKFILNGDSKNVSKEKIIDMLIDVCEAMNYLHKNKMIHRDLKWQNVLLTDNYECKISDFGLVKLKDTFFKNIDQGIVGTYIYIAPEAKENHYSTKIDVYAFGLMMFELLCGCIDPWKLDENTNKMDDLSIYLHVKQNSNFRPNVEHLKNNGYESFVTLCKKCWSHNPNYRPSFKELITILEKKKSELNSNI